MPANPPLLKVSRTVAACQRCRSAKVKCDGKLPACSKCEKDGKGADCWGTSDEFAKGKERSYVATLEAQVERLEKKIAEARKRRALAHSVNADAAHSHDRNSTRLLHSASDRPDTRNEASSIDDLVSDFGSLTVNATTRDFYGFTSDMSYACLVLAASGREPLPTTPSTPLPPRHVATRMIEPFFYYSFTILPFFNEASFYASFNAVYEGNGNNASAWDNYVVRIILAICYTALAKNRAERSYREGVSYVTVALNFAEQVFRPGSITSIQALLLLSAYAFNDPQHFDSFTLIGAASRTMVDIGLHQDPPKNLKMSKAELDLRRRVFWSVYALDRSTSITQGRAFSFSDDSANVGLPSPSQWSSTQVPPALQPSRPRDTAIEYFRLRRIQSVWYQDIFQSSRDPWPEPHEYIWRACHELNQWFKNLRPFISSTDHNSFFQLEVLWSLVYVLAPSEKVPVPCEYAQSLLCAYSIQYANKLMATVGHAEVAPITFYDSMRLYLVAKHFIGTLERNRDRMLSGVVPDPPVLPPDCPPPPPLYPSEEAAAVSHAIACIEQMLELLGRFGEKFGYMIWRDSLQRESDVLLADLQHRRRVSNQLGSPPFSRHDSTESAPAFRSPYQLNESASYVPHQRRSDSGPAFRQDWAFSSAANGVFRTNSFDQDPSPALNPLYEGNPFGE